jgi:cytochrome d ubiquinol oxidase subunit I
MIALGTALTGLSLVSCLLWATGQLWDTRSRFTRAILALLVLSPLLAQVATQAGWFTAEMGRQPWIVYEILLTKEAFSASVSALQVLTSILLFLLIYLLLSILFVSQLLQIIRRGPRSVESAAQKPGAREFPSLKSGRHTKI